MSEPPKIEAKEEDKEKIESKEAPAEGKEVGTCDVKTIKALSKVKENEHGAMVVFTHKSCKHCSPFLEEIKKVVGESKIPILQADLDDADCMDMADELNVDKTPTAFVYQQGKRVGRVVPSGKSYVKAMAKLSDMLDIERPKEVVIHPGKVVLEAETK